MKMLLFHLSPCGRGRPLGRVRGRLHAEFFDIPLKLYCPLTRLCEATSPTRGEVKEP